MDNDYVPGVSTYQNGLGIDNKLKVANTSTSNYFLIDHLGSAYGLMITLDKLRIFKRYRDIDSFGRMGSEKERQILSDHEWYLIDTMLQDATVIIRNLGSEQRIAQADQRLRVNSDTPAIVDEIKRLAATPKKTGRSDRYGFFLALSSWLYCKM